MRIAIALLGIVAISQLAVGLLLFLEGRTTRRVDQRLFAGVTLTTLTWTMINGALAFVDSADTSHFNVFSLLNRAGYLLGTIVLLEIYIFTLYYPEKKKKTLAQKLIMVFGVFSAIVAPLKVVAGDFIIKDGEYLYEPGALAIIIGIFAIFVLGSIYFTDIKILKRTTDRLLKRQTITLLSGLTLTVVHATAFIVILPLVFGDNAYLYLIGYMAPVYFISLTVFSLLKQGLFDIRLIVARSVGYILTLTTLVGVYVFAIFGLSSNLLGTGGLTGLQQALYILATLIFGFSLNPLKRFFDKLTNRLFYRDAYDAQVLLDKLNKVLVGNIDLDVLLKQTSDLIATTLKAEFAAFIIRETESTARRASFSKLVNLNTDDILALRAQKKSKTELFVADEIENDRDRQKEVMNANNIAIAAHLAGTGGTGNTGYLLLGPKQSGNPYNKQDLQVLDIIANELVIAIQNALRFEEIETFNITLQEKVDEATRQLRRTNEKLKEIDETKDEFISMASHQLRTPLTSVKGYVSMVVEGDAGKITKQQKELLDQAFASSQRMVYLIADLLNVSRLKTGKFIIENKPTPLADVIETEMQQLQDMANTKEQTLTYVKPKDFPDLNLDETKIRQVIMNFTDNALHYTPAGGHIAVNLEEKADSIEFTVVDDGLGVPKSEQHHLFGKFYRAGNAKKVRPDGTGLGLFMAKKVIVAQGGAVIFKSEEGKGSTFGFTFPKKTVLAKK